MIYSKKNKKNFTFLLILHVILKKSHLFNTDFAIANAHHPARIVRGNILNSGRFGVLFSPALMVRWDCYLPPEVIAPA